MPPAAGHSLPQRPLFIPSLPRADELLIPGKPICYEQVPAPHGTGRHTVRQKRNRPRRRSVSCPFANKKSPGVWGAAGAFQRERESIGCFQYEIKKSAPPYRFSGDSSRSGETPKYIDSWSTIDIILRVNFSDKTLFEKLYQKSAAFPALFCSYIWALSSAIKLCAGTAPIMR